MNVRSLFAALVLLASVAWAASPDPLEKKSLEVLEQGMAAKNPETRKLAAVSLSLAGTNDELQRRLEGLLDDKDVEVRQAAIASLSDIHNQKAKEALVRAMNDSVPEVSFAAAKALWGLKETSGRGALLSVLEGESKTSSGLFTEKKREALRMMHTPKTAFMMALREGVGFVPVPGLGEGISSMQSLLGDPSLSGRASAALLLGADANPQTLAALKDATHDKTWSVRAAAVHSLALHNDPALKAAIAPLIDDQNEAVKLRAAAGYLRLRAVELQPKPKPAPARGQKK
jgi:HEAT repeat protein